MQNRFLKQVLQFQAPFIVLFLVQFEQDISMIHLSPFIQTDREQ